LIIPLEILIFQFDLEQYFLRIPGENNVFLVVEGLEESVVVAEDCALVDETEGGFLFDGKI
jgi:hypothetical protein